LLFPTFSKTKKTHFGVAVEQLHKELNPTKAIKYEEGYILKQNKYNADSISDLEDKAITLLSVSQSTTIMPLNIESTAVIPTILSTALPTNLSTFIPTSAQDTTPLNTESATIVPTALSTALPTFIPTSA
jgi:hypothetical protein